ncbi:hypothetical protein IAG44_20085 [Streptomyces roseirectus]|uniref:Uncharacterized protein n=1 Tax=Streptomyces roseirectus TaxID=2768066 RepID=A0A7H0IFD5_9ACTN|nr:hypothetical protein [Streptomyces roseirectus]QNP71501.1 hypothetical protein IAG44_20085 [Streptomyces roseirectus]
MRDFIVHALSCALRILLPRRRPGRHTAAHLTPTAPKSPLATPVIPESPWSRPWTSPSKAEAAEIFRRQAEAEESRRLHELHLQRERRHAAALASLGIDYPYTYEGAPFTDFPLTA